MPDPNIISFPGLNLVYIGICKAGNSSVKQAFMNALGQSGENQHRKDRFLYVGYEYAEDAAKNGWMVFSLIRHPRARFESCFRQKVWRPEGLHPGFKRKGYEAIKWKMPFDKFLKFVARTPDEQSEQHFRSMHYDLYTKDGKPRYTHIGRLERINTDWPHICREIEKHCGLELNPTLPKINGTSGKNEAPVKWDQNKHRIHHKRFKQDYEVLGYEL